MKIDLHTHIVPKSWPDLRARYGYGGFVQLEHHGPGCARMTIDGNLFREIEDNCWSPRRRIAADDLELTGFTADEIQEIAFREFCDGFARLAPRLAGFPQLQRGPRTES
jgi:hypothetical protein